MILHLLYIIAFTILAVLAIANMVRNLVNLGIESQRSSAVPRQFAVDPSGDNERGRSVPHPEFLDDAGNLINEPLLVMRSMTVEDAREHLDALYDASPGSSNFNTESREE